MATLGYADLPVPAGGQSPTVPADLAALAEAIDPHLRQTAADLADRTTKYATAPAHTLVTADDGTMWLKTSSVTDTWVTIWQPPPVWDLALTLSAGLQEGDVELALMIVDGGRQVALKGRIEKVDATKITDPNAVNLGAVPTDCIPPELRTWVGACSMAGTTTDAAGRLEVLGDSTTSAYGDTGDLLWWYQGTDGTDWVDISGSYWLI
ncbi:hypothetical protein [Streptomyces europaeiscabiei]|uniref:hypothetical protein n=1 Tax=Streptomyces europaeiscabiei TaxID=146819 RepID=UPI0029AC314E|nr:hypothetical protein [Streptomyces europaeiscabiei]MDX3839057.1 hypothetical protein [Streptomyces europaeiscabiei]